MLHDSCIVFGMSLHQDPALPGRAPSLKAALAFAAAAVVIAAVAGALDDGKAAAVTAGMVVEAKERCEVTIKQYGPGERWRTSSLAPVCAGPVVPAPAYVMSNPITEAR